MLAVGAWILGFLGVFSCVDDLNACRIGGFCVESWFRFRVWDRIDRVSFRDC
jgi:hypothetical protein